MSRKASRVPFHLDSKGIRSLLSEEIRAILRGADDLIMHGGRSLLVKILKGSRSKDVLERNLDKSPVYGYYRGVSEEDVLAKIDWTILNQYLAVEYDHRLPMLIYTDKGWAIERETYSDELLQELRKMAPPGAGPLDLEYLKDKNRDVVWLILDKIAASADRIYLPALEAWEQIAYKKVRQRIRQVSQQLSGLPD